ncbi:MULTISPECIES: ankyrin repeat domain-containing protein [unclassified Schlesneria]|uniref:ankyrin repeat domain-containing protein n=2 Tax=Schlesneria TaxID=656899 RepID=UPI002F088C2E
MSLPLLRRLAEGRTDLVFELIGSGMSATSTDEQGTPLLSWCAYYGDVSAIKFLLQHGESLSRLGDNLDLSGAAFHGHWRLCQYLIEHGADVDWQQPDTGESPLHAALCTTIRLAHDLVLKVLLQSGANPNCVTRPNRETGCFMRDCRTKGETPLHRAAAFGTEETIQLLLDAGSNREAKDQHGDSPLAWASWYARPDSILRPLCYGPYNIRAGRASMAANVLGRPIPQSTGNYGGDDSD